MTRRGSKDNESGSSASGPRPSEYVSRDAASPSASTKSSPSRGSDFSSQVREIANPSSQRGGVTTTRDEVPRSLSELTNSGDGSSTTRRELADTAQQVADVAKPLDPAKREERKLRNDVRSAHTVIGATRVAVAQKKKADVKLDKRPHCKTRPNRGSGSGGGKGFVPWC